MSTKDMETLMHDPKVVLFPGDVLVYTVVGGTLSAGHETVHAPPRIHEHTSHSVQHIIRLSCARLSGNAVHLIKVFNFQSNHLP